MSQSESFVDEVSEEVRRDRLFGLLRRYGWIPVLGVVVLVGGTAYVNYTRAQAEKAAEARGDALYAALSQDDSQARLAALAALPADAASSVVAAMLTAAAQQEAGDSAAAAATLDAAASDPAATPIYHDMMALKAAMLRAALQTPAERQAALAPLAVPGAPFRLLATEQIALAQIDDNDPETAIATLQSIVDDAEVSRGLRERAQNLIVALGGVVEPDPAPAE